MKLLFSAMHLAYFRNFESVIRELAARGHQIHLAAEEPETMGGRELAQLLHAAYPGVTSGFLPSLEAEPWFDAARRLRLGLDYVRALQPEYAGVPKLRIRARERAPRVVRWGTSLPVVGVPILRRAITRTERLLPRSPQLDRYLAEHAPDLVVLTSLTYSRSQQLDLLKSARARRIPVAAAIMSWDHLSSKALLHIAPDMVLVWNELQREEAVQMHGLPADRVVVTGAQCYDQWFGRRPTRSREEFCAAMGLRPDRPFILWVHSAFSPMPELPEPVLVTRWLEALRRSDDPRLRELGVLIRPHPERIKEWAGIDLAPFGNVVFHGRNPIDGSAKDDYFDALFHSAAVVGLVTSAFLEAAIVGRPVLALLLPEYRMHYEMRHFQYLITGGLVRTSFDIETSLQHVGAAIDLRGGRDEGNLAFLTSFVRPAGLETPATPAFVAALERLHRAGAHADPSLEQHAWLRPVVAAAATRSGRAPLRWLMADMRQDVRDEERERRDRAVETRAAAKDARQRDKVRLRTQRIRRDRWRHRGKEVGSSLRMWRHRAYVTMWRAMVVAGLWRQDKEQM
jgi:hypothetical protein